MPSSNLIVALVFAAIFGTALIWLTLYYVHRYIHQQCLELDHWFHLTTLRRHERHPCCDDMEQGRSSHSKIRSRSKRREKSRGRSQYEKRSRESPEARDVDMQWAGQRHRERAQRMLPASEPMHHQWQEQQFHPSFRWHGQPPSGAPMVYTQPMPSPQTAEQGAAQASRPTMPAAALQQPFTQKAPAMNEPSHYQRQYQHPHGETRSDTRQGSQREKPSATSKSAQRQRATPKQVDYIHICDEYPPIILEALKKNEGPYSSPCSSSSSSSSDTSATTQEVPRASIPRSTPRFANKLPFQFPQYSHLATRSWDDPTSYPRQ